MIRLASGAVLATAAVAAILFLPVLALRVVAVVVAALAAAEYLRIVKADVRMYPAAALVCWLVSAPLPTSLPISGLALLPLLMMAIVAGLVLFGGVAAGPAAAAAFSLVYIGVPLGMMVGVHAARGREATLLLVATVVVSDSMQYYTGRMFGRRPLAPSVSPKKTIEGALGGVVFGALFMALAGPFVFAGTPRAALAILGLGIVVLGILGDLFESRLKRQADVKDSSNLIPGHGGALDRIDALLFAIPAFSLFAGMTT
jgi:phosphatidate cytidylyltransferase